MNLPACEEVARLFALAMPYEPHRVVWPYFATPKLNGIRAMWVPKVGFLSRQGIPWEPGKFPHLENALQDTNLWLDGELYAHGMSLQDISKRTSIGSDKSHADAISIQFHVFDNPQDPKGFEERQVRIEKQFANHQFIKLLPFYDCNCETKGNTKHEAFVSAGYEGTVFKHPGSYFPGRTKMCFKRKAWLDEDFTVLDLVAGTGKYDHSMGAVRCITAAGVEFSVGSFELTDRQRLDIFVAGTKPATAKVKYRELSDGGVPMHSRIMALW